VNTRFLASRGSYVWRFSAAVNEVKQLVFGLDFKWAHIGKDARDQIRSNADFFLNASLVKSGIAATQEHLHGLVLQRVGNFLPPAVARINAEDVGKHDVPCGLKARGKPEHKVVVLGRGLADEHDASCCPAYALGRVVLGRHNFATTLL